VLSGQAASAEPTTFKERTDNWLRSANESGKPGIDPDTPTPEDPQAPTDGAPVGDGILPLAVLTLSYGARLYNRKRKY
jgi:hypothetical protein